MIPFCKDIRALAVAFPAVLFSLSTEEERLAGVFTGLFFSGYEKLPIVQKQICKNKNFKGMRRRLSFHEPCQLYEVSHPQLFCTIFQ
jgi:hypothetical protein